MNLVVQHQVFVLLGLKKWFLVQSWCVSKWGSTHQHYSVQPSNSGAGAGAGSQSPNALQNPLLVQVNYSLYCIALHLYPIAQQFTPQQLLVTQFETKPDHKMSKLQCSANTICSNGHFEGLNPLKEQFVQIPKCNVVRVTTLLLSTDQTSTAGPDLQSTANQGVSKLAQNTSAKKWGVPRIRPLLLLESQISPSADQFLLAP